MTRTAAAASPLQCVWIVRGSEGSVGSYSYALCGRYQIGPRVVSEEECASCDLWQPSPVLERREIAPLSVHLQPPVPRTASIRYSLS
jgi:hypothetical protein